MTCSLIIAGISITLFDEVLMDDRFLMYAVGEFGRYVDELNTAVRNYQMQMRRGNET